MANLNHRTPLRGFAAASPAKRKELGRRGGLAAQARGKCNRFTSESGHTAGTKGALALKTKMQATGRDFYREIGRLGNLARRGRVTNPKTSGSTSPMKKQ